MNVVFEEPLAPVVEQLAVAVLAAAAALDIEADPMVKAVAARTSPALRPSTRPRFMRISFIRPARLED
ncbi:hypothetical protein OH791_27335 [Streptomyces anulatus]|uniref:hypothetical protein n=1 Tax=Streptomyces anulatus TaxID=1892 RepID=UPI00386A5AFE|nr:hypothetical protein OH791_27335 [Streptomyces anulatus]